MGCLGFKIGLLEDKEDATRSTTKKNNQKIRDVNLKKMAAN